MALPRTNKLEPNILSGRMVREGMAHFDRAMSVCCAYFGTRFCGGVKIHTSWRAPAVDIPMHHLPLLYHLIVDFP